MENNEVLLTEHRELVELYKHQWTTFFYLDVSYVILNGALASVIGLLLSLETVATTIATLVCFMLAIIGNIVFFLFAGRIQAYIISLKNKAVKIENIFEERDLPLTTFKGSTVAIEQGRFLIDSNGTYAELKAWQKISVFKALFFFTVVLGLSWILLLIIYVTFYLL